MATGIPLIDVFTGFQQSKQYANQAQAARIEGEMARIRGTEIGEQSRDQLRQVLGNIEAIRTSRNVSGDSPTAQAIQARTIQDANRNEMIARLAETMRASASDAQAKGYTRAAKWAVPLSYADSLATGFQQVASAMGGG